MKKLELDLELVKRLYFEDIRNLHEIGKELGCCKDTIISFLKKNNVEVDRPIAFERKRNDKGYCSLIKKLYCEENKTIIEISKELKISHELIVPILKNDPSIIIKQINDYDRPKRRNNKASFKKGEKRKLGIPWTEDQKQKLSDKKKEMYRNDPGLIKRVKAGQAKISPDIKRKMAEDSSVRMLKLLENGKLSLSNGFMTGSYTSKKTGEEMKYFSSYELKRFEFLDDQKDVKNFTTSHGIKIPYIGLSGNVKRYIPDILIEYDSGKIILEEVKGFVKSQQELELKNKAGKDFCEKSGFEFRIVFRKDLRVII